MRSDAIFLSPLKSILQGEEDELWKYKGRNHFSGGDRPGCHGFPISGNIVKEGFDVIGYDILPKRIDELEAIGGKAATSPQAVADKQSAFEDMAKAGMVLLENHSKAHQHAFILMPFGLQCFLWARNPKSYTNQRTAGKRRSLMP